jgi:hemerythrin-like domain-containing protein
MNIFQVIETDHSLMRDTLQELRETTIRSRKKREQKFGKLQDQVSEHLQAEETLFYSYLMDKGDREELLEALEEHEATRAMMKSLALVPVDNERWGAKLKVLGEIVEHHIEEEETKIFDRAKELIEDGQAQTMADEFERLKKQVRQRGQAVGTGS